MLLCRFLSEEKGNGNPKTMKHDAWLRSSAKCAYISDYGAVVVPYYCCE